MEVFDAVESEVRAYCRHWPTVFARAQGSILLDEHGRSFIDFFAGASALNYGHNHPALQEALIQYVLRDGIVHGLDMATTAKRAFLEALTDIVLGPRNLEYKVQFPGPAGVNAVEAALRLARKATGRDRVLGFDGGFHGMAAGALQVSDHHHGGYTCTPNAGSIPFDNHTATLEPGHFENAVLRLGVAPDQVAAVIVEVVQGEGGVRTARRSWLAALEVFCRTYDILIVVDDIQAGCGRTGPFLSFEHHGIDPDIVCLSKSISGYGLPLSLLLLRPSLDVWRPGEHNGTFRGNNLAFVTGAMALNLFWVDGQLQQATERRENSIRNRLRSLADRRPDVVRGISGCGMFWGVQMSNSIVAAAVRQAAFDHGLLLETCGATGDVLKIIPPLTIADEELDCGLSVLEECVALAARFEEGINDCTLV